MLILYNAAVSKSGRYFVIYGPVGSGKSTLAKQISQRIGVPHIELDDIFWLPGWVGKPADEFRADVTATLSKYANGWVCDGNYYELRPLFLPLADFVVWLCPPFRVAFWRLFKRTFSNCWSGKLLWGMNRDIWRQAFFSHKSILFYQVTHWRAYCRMNKNLEEIPHRAIVIQLHSQKEADAFLSGLK